MDFPRLIGSLGLILISIGVLQRAPKIRNSLFAYSISIQDSVFAVLQLVFAASAVYDLNRANRSSYTPLPSLPKSSSSKSEHFASVPGGVIPERSK